MKMKPEHLALLQAKCSEVLSANPGMQARYQQNGLSPKRFRWDVLYAAKLTSWVCDTLYPYLNDDHIDTALRQIMKEPT